MTCGSIDLQYENHIATLLINRPDKLNALTPEMLEQLETHCKTLENNNEVRAVLLKSASPKVFCVGADINRWNSLTPLDMWRSWIRRGHQVFDLLAQLPQPVIALVHGLAYGGGLELAAAADIRICSDNARFALPETGLATVPGWSGSQRLNKIICSAVVKEMVFTGEPLNSKRALDCGLVNLVVSDDSLSEAGYQMAERIALRAPISVQIAKQIIDAGEGIATARTLEALAGMCSASTQDAHEGGAAFREKRLAKFNGY